MHRNNLLINAPLVTIVTAACVPARGSHTDLSVPDFSAYRNSHTEKPNERSSGGALGKKAAGYVILGGMYPPPHLSSHTYTTL